MKSLTMLLLTVVVAWPLAACAPVKAYQREKLSHRAMRSDSRPEEARARMHMIGARESSQGGAGEAGGGCGCN